MTHCNRTSSISRFCLDESGATAIEYGLIASLIAIAIIAGATAVGSNVAAAFNAIASQIKTS
jgi:pilus assembly protein Flp/PilA